MKIQIFVIAILFAAMSLGYADTWSVNPDGSTEILDGDGESEKAAQDNKQAEERFSSLAGILGGLPAPPDLKDAVIMLPPDPKKNKEEKKSDKVPSKS